jgi:hypothetical protein
MIFEYAVDPALFSNFNDCRIIFDNFSQEQGRLIAGSPKDWQRQVLKNIKKGEIQPVRKKSIKVKLKKLLKESLIKNRNLSSWDAECSWLENIAKENNIIPYAAVLTEQKQLNPIESYEASSLFLDAPECWSEHTQVSVVRKAKDIVDVIDPLLLLSQNIVIIDRYFKVGESTSANVLKEIIKRANKYCFGKGINKITIHVSDRYQNFKSLGDSVQEYLPDGFTVLIYSWDDSIIWHNRFLITDVAGFDFGHGLSEMRLGLPQSHTDSCVDINILSFESNKRKLERLSNKDKATFVTEIEDR